MKILTQKFLHDLAALLPIFQKKKRHLHWVESDRIAFHQKRSFLDGTLGLHVPLEQIFAIVIWDKRQFQLILPEAPHDLETFLHVCSAPTPLRPADPLFHVPTWKNPPYIERHSR